MKTFLLLVLFVIAGTALTEDAAASEDHEINVLLVGNGATAQHDLRTLVKTVFEVGRPGLTVNTRRIVCGGKNLFTRWNYLHAQKILEISTIDNEKIRNSLETIQENRSLDELPADYVKFPETIGESYPMGRLSHFKNALGWAERPRVR
ncbi:MAG: hypothetical protein AAGI37_18940 [Planctomycetota bacterium]